MTNVRPLLRAEGGRGCKALLLGRIPTREPKVAADALLCRKSLSLPPAPADMVR